MEAEKIKICDCGSEKFWVSGYGEKFCAACNPPADNFLVARWIEKKSAESETKKNQWDFLGDVHTAEVEEIIFQPREVDPEILRLDWPGGVVPDWVHWRTEVGYVRAKINGRSVLSIARIEKPFWLAMENPPWPAPVRGQRSELPFCYWCGRELFWLNRHGEECCWVCKPPRTGKGFENEVQRFFLKPGVSSLDVSSN